eukprot:9239367-Pyramimonas_sp.AAC.1
MQVHIGHPGAAERLPIPMTLSSRLAMATPAAALRSRRGTRLEIGPTHRASFPDGFDRMDGLGHPQQKVLTR